jgi:predicted PurR-regulated permease PerM
LLLEGEAIKTSILAGEPRPGADEELAGEERRALRWTAVVAVAAIVWLVRPVGMGVFLGMLMAFAFQAVHERALRRLPPAPAALVTVLASTVLVALAVGGLAWLLVRDGIVLGREVVASLGSGGIVRDAIASVARVTSRVGISGEDLTARVKQLAESAVSSAASLAEAVAATAASSLLAFFFAMLTMYFILTHWRSLSAAAQETLPLRADYTRRLFEEFRVVGRTTLLGTVGSGFAQGALATLGYWIAGMPRPEFFGAATALASLVPAVGTLLVWVPAGIALILLGHAWRGIFVLVWGTAIVTALNDYVIRPRLVGGAGGVPALATFIALFGGVEALGLKGLVVGPVVMSLAIAVLRLYAEEARQRRAAGKAP